MGNLFLVEQDRPPSIAQATDTELVCVPCGMGRTEEKKGMHE